MGNSAVRATAGVCVIAAALAIGVGAAAASGGSPFDGTSSASAVSPGAVLATASFALGEVDLNALGVSPTDLATVGLVGATSMSAGDGPNMFIVDDDHLQCPNAGFTSIQAAVDASGPGDQIKVCSGNYSEQVRIQGSQHDGLRLFSQVPLQATISMPPAEAFFPRSIVLVEGARDVDIRHFTITGPFYLPGCTEAIDRHTGVRVFDGSATLYGNHITQIRNVNPALLGCQDGVAVLIGRQFEGQVGTATIRNNLIDLYQKGAIVVDNTGSYALITQNEIDGDLALSGTTAQNGVQVGRGASADVDHNEIRDNFYCCNNNFDTAAGVLLFETAAHVTVGHNGVTNNGVGIDIDEGAVGLTIDHNDVTKNRNNGVAAFDQSSGNTISYNKATNNVPVDCFDDTFGGGTAGTANFWIKDMGLTQNRPGLCKKATP
jgi:hypothetical protein